MRPRASDIELVPAEFTEHVLRALAAHEGRALRVELTVLGLSNAGGGAELTVPADRGPGEAAVCAWWSEGERPNWLERPAHVRHPRPKSWVRVDDDFRTTVPDFRTDDHVRSSIELMLAGALEVLGMFPPHMWYLQVALQLPVGPRRLVDLRALDPAPFTLPAVRFPGCGSEGHIAHAFGECDVHTPCITLDCSSPTETRHEFQYCTGCPGLTDLPRPS